MNHYGSVIPFRAETWDSNTIKDTEGVWVKARVSDRTAAEAIVVLDN